MGFILLYRDSAGAVTFLDKIFGTENECYEFVKSHSAVITDYQICSQEEVQQYMAEQQASAQQQYQQKQGGYKSHVDITIDETEPEAEPKPIKPIFVRNYRPAFITFPAVGKRRK